MIHNEYMIKSFKDKPTRQAFEGKQISKGISASLQDVAWKKLLILNRVSYVEDLKIPPSNHLEKLYGDRKTYYSIRVNKQWRICFIFEDGNAYDVELVDYH